MGTWSVVMSTVCGCTLLYVNMHHDQGYYVKSTEQPLANTRLKIFTILYFIHGSHFHLRIDKPVTTSIIINSYQKCVLKPVKSRLPNKEPAFTID